MDIIGEKVIHGKWGEGVITNLIDNKITVKFSERDSKFLYPTAFSDHLKMKNENIQKAIEESMLSKIHKTIEPPNYFKNIKFFYVFQNKTYAEERDAGILWAPIKSESGREYFHWDNLKEVCLGDIILHSFDGYLVNISLAKSSWEYCQQPQWRDFGTKWHAEGRKVDCLYIPIKNPIKTSNYREDILRLTAGEEKSPFNRNGTGNQVYLCKLNKKLASFFIKEIVKSNLYLKELPYINELLDFLAL